MADRDEAGRFLPGNRFWEARSSAGPKPKFADGAFLGVVETPGSPTHSLKIVRATGTANTDGGRDPATGDQVEYAQGYFHSPIDFEQTATTHEGFSVTFKQNERQVKAVNPTVV